VWFEATDSFYKKLNRIPNQCGLSSYEALSRGLDALRRETGVRNSALNRNIKSPALGSVLQNHGAGLAQLVGYDQPRRKAHKGKKKCPGAMEPSR
jgi:hypothetical protein